MKTAEHKPSPTISRSASPFFRKGMGSGHFQAKNDESSFFKKGSTKEPVQAQLNVSQPNDPHEKEADAMANKVVQRMGNAEKGTKEEDKGSNKITPVVQKKCADCNEEENTQRKHVEENKPVNKKANEKPEDKHVQQKTSDPLKDDKSVHRKEEKQDYDDDISVQKKEDDDQASSQPDHAVIENKLNNYRGNGTPLASDTRKNMESAMDADFSGVRIHNDHNAAQLNKDLSAHAFTRGNDIYFNAGKYDDTSKQGNELLAHELTHSLQQGTSIKRSSQVGSRSNDSHLHSAVSRAAFTPHLQKKDGDPKTPTASELIDKYTTLGFLSEAKLVGELVTYLPANIQLVNDVLDKVHDFQKDDIAYETTIALGSKINTVPVSLRIRLIKEMVYGFVSDTEEKAISDIWKSFDDPTRPFIAEENRAVWDKSLNESEYLVQFVKPQVDAFIADVTGLAQAYLEENEHVVQNDASQYGINLENPYEKLDKENEHFQSVKAMIPGIITLKKQLEDMRKLRVGYYNKPDCLAGECLGDSFFNPEYEPSVPPKKTESPPWPEWKDVKTQYDRVSALIASFSEIYPSIYILIQQDKLDTLDQSKDSTEALKVIADALVKTRGKIVEAKGKINISIQYTDLKMTQVQLFNKTSAVPFETRFPWDKPYYKDIADADLKGKAEKQFWVDLGLSMLAAAALIAAPFTGGASAALLIGFGLGIGLGQAVNSWDKYLNMSTVGDASAKDELSLISKGEISAQLVDAIVSTVALFLDAYGAKAATSGAKASREAFELAEKEVQAQLSQAARQKALKTIAKDGAIAIGGAGVSVALHELENDEPDYNIGGSVTNRTIDLGPDDDSTPPDPVNKMPIQRVPNQPVAPTVPKAPLVLTGGEFELFAEKALRQGQIKGLPRMDFVIPGQYTGSGWGIDRIGIVWNQKTGAVEVYHLEMKFVSEGSLHIPGLGTPVAGTQTGERWTANAIKGFLENQHPVARAGRERLRRALNKMHPNETIDLARMRLFLTEKLTNAPIHIITPEWANLSKLYKQVAALIRHGREISIINKFKK